MQNNHVIVSKVRHNIGLRASRTREVAEKLAIRHVRNFELAAAQEYGRTRLAGRTNDERQRLVGAQLFHSRQRLGQMGVFRRLEDGPGVH